MRTIFWTIWLSRRLLLLNVSIMRRAFFLSVRNILGSLFPSAQGARCAYIMKGWGPECHLRFSRNNSYWRITIFQTSIQTSIESRSRKHGNLFSTEMFFSGHLYAIVSAVSIFFFLTLTCDLKVCIEGDTINKKSDKNPPLFEISEE